MIYLFLKIVLHFPQSYQPIWNNRWGSWFAIYMKDFPYTLVCVYIYMHMQHTYIYTLVCVYIYAYATYIYDNSLTFMQRGCYGLNFKCPLMSHVLKTSLPTYGIIRSSCNLQLVEPRERKLGHQVCTLQKGLFAFSLSLCFVASVRWQALPHTPSSPCCSDPTQAKTMAPSNHRWEPQKFKTHNNISLLFHCLLWCFVIAVEQNLCLIVFILMSLVHSSL